MIGALLGMFVPSEGGIAILGDVFVGALKAIAPLLVFFLVISSLCYAGKSHGGVIRTVIIMYMFSTFLAAIVAVTASSVFPVTLTLVDAATDMAAPGCSRSIKNTSYECGNKPGTVFSICKLHRHPCMGRSYRYRTS